MAGTPKETAEDAITEEEMTAVATPGQISTQPRKTNACTNQLFYRNYYYSMLISATWLYSHRAHDSQT